MTAWTCSTVLFLAAVLYSAAGSSVPQVGGNSVRQPILTTLQNATQEFTFPDVQLASTTVYNGVYYGINTYGLIAVEVASLTVMWTKTLNQLYTSYVMGGAARLMVTPEHVIVSTRVIDGISMYGWTAAFTRANCTMVWNISNLANIGDVPTFLFTPEASGSGRLSLYAANFSDGGYQPTCVTIAMSTGGILNSIDVSRGSVSFLPDLSLAIVFVSNAYNAKYIEAFDLNALRPAWRVESLSVNQFEGFQNLITASNDFVVISNSTSTDADTVNLMFFYTTSGLPGQVLFNVAFQLNSESLPTLDITSSRSCSLLTFWQGTILYFNGLDKSTLQVLWSTTVNVSEASYSVYGADTVVTLTMTPVLTIHNYTSGFHTSISSNLNVDGMSSWPQLWTYTTNVIMVPYQVNAPLWSAGFQLFNATSGARMGNMTLSDITYDTLWSETPTYALEYAPNYFVIDNTATLYLQTFQ
jgi:hypothetical protein